MSQVPVPPPPDSLPEQPGFRQQSKYRRPRRFISWWGLTIGLILGIAGGVYLSWVQFPVIETDTKPDQLRETDQAQYVVAIALSFAHDSDLGQAIERLSMLDLGPDPLQAVADIACDLARSGYVADNTGLRAVRAMRTFYQLQGRSGCADTLLPDVRATQVIEIEVPTPTPTLPPPPTKTPAPSNASPTPSGLVIVPTTPPRSSFSGSIFGTFCSTTLSGVIEVYVRDAGNTAGIPGQRVRVQWDGGASLFSTGLKPERDPGYGDFQMEDGKSYIVSMPGLSDPISSPLAAEPCFTDFGEEATKSYRVAFVRTGG